MTSGTVVDDGDAAVVDASVAEVVRMMLLLQQVVDDVATTWFRRLEMKLSL